MVLNTRPPENLRLVYVGQAGDHRDRSRSGQETVH
jgi:hypothetical protein